MGSVVSSILGTGGGARGTGFSGPTSANIQNPVNTQQATMSYDQNQNALYQQQQLLNQLNAQNGLQNQSSVYNQLQGVANGTGPNPALALLNQQTGANVANQNALMAGQRGASSNVGLIARQAAMQGANTQQNAIGQAATTQANQSLGALNSMGALANTQAGNQINATTANTQANQSEQQNLLNSIAQQNNANVGMQSNINTANAGLTNTVLGQQGNVVGNVMGGVGAALHLANGGAVPKKMADGGPVDMDPNSPVAGPIPAPMPLTTTPIQTMASTVKQQGPRSNAVRHLLNYTADPMAANQTQDALGMGANKLGQGIGSALRSGYDAIAKPSLGNNEDASLEPTTMVAAKGGKVPAMVSPDEHYLSPKDVKKVAEGKAEPLEVGERIPGKAKVKGNSYANDIVPKTLESGGIVIPRSVMESKNPHWAAKKFVEQVMMAKGGKVSFPKSGKSLPKKSK